MNINLMRNIDFWMGIPLCFFFTLIHYFGKILFPKKVDKGLSPKKILFLELSEMGSAILAYPAMAKIKEFYPDAKIYFWIFKRNRVSIDVLNIIPEENVIVMRDDTLWLLAIDTLRSIWRIRKEKIDTVIDLGLYSRFNAILSYLSGAKIRAGFYKFYQEGLYRGNMQTHKVLYNSQIHISLNFISLVQALKSPREDLYSKVPLDRSKITLPVIESEEKAKEKMWNKLKQINNAVTKNSKIVILNISSSQLLPLRRWPIENYIRLVNRLLQDLNVFVIVIGLDAEPWEKQSIFEMIRNERCIDFMGKTDMRELLHLFNIAQLFISHDSGPVHFAALTKIGIIALFGPETPRAYAPLSSKKTILYANFACSPCISAYNFRRSPCRNNRCLQAISVEQVYRSAKSYLYK